MNAALTYVKIGVALTVGVGAIAAGFWYSTPPGANRAAHQPASQAMMDAIRRAEAERAANPPEAPPADSTADPPPDDTAAAVPPELQELIAQSMPGVVMIQTSTGFGSGFYVRPDLVMTNAHVVGTSKSVSVTTQNRDKLAGQVALVAENLDVALVRVGRLGIGQPQLKLGESGSLRLGEDVVRLGWAETVDQSTVSRGVVTGLRTFSGRPLLQTDAAPNHGDSGGPVLNRRGEVVGITMARASDGSAGFTVPIDEAKPLLEQVSYGGAMSLASEPAADDLPAPAASAPAGPSAAETLRAAGAEAFATALTALAQRADRLDGGWDRFKASCPVPSLPGGQTHEWFHVYDPRSPVHPAAANCPDAINPVRQEADAISGAMNDADEAARRADVYPGTRREIRRRFRLDYAGWDR